MNKIDYERLFSRAIEREVEASRFYTELADIAKNSAVKESFLELAKEEQGHKEILQQYKEDPGVGERLNIPVEDFKVAQSEEFPPLSSAMRPRDAMALAMKKEQAAVDFYRVLAQSSTDKELKGIFQTLSNMELGHKHRLETMFVNVGYPEVF